jgi:hypothetical protein
MRLEVLFFNYKNIAIKRISAQHSPLELAAADVPAPNPADAAFVDKLWPHSLGALIKALHIAVFIASALLETCTLAPLIKNVGEPPIPRLFALSIV